MSILDKVHQKHLNLMQITLATLGSLIKITPAEHWHDRTDGADGWTASEALGHLVDADRIFAGRVRLMLAEDQPPLTVFDHDQLVIDNDYKHADPHALYATLKASRAELVALLESLTPEQWARTGTHPNYGEWTMTDSAMQVGIHDSIHIEQITRTLTGEA